MPATHLPDPQLVAASLQRDAEAWDALVERYIRFVRALALRAGATQAQAEGIVRAVFDRLLGKLELLRREAVLAGWMAEATLEACEQQLPSIVDIYATLPHQEVLRLWKQHAIRLGIQQLAERCQTTLRLLFYDRSNPSPARIAQQLSIPENEIAPLRARCLRYLRSVMEKGDAAAPDDLAAPDVPAWDRQSESARIPLRQPCPILFEQVIAHALGEDADAERQEIESHLQDQSCQRCCELHTWVLETIALMRSDDSAEPSAQLVQEVKHVFRAPKRPQPTPWQPLARPARWPRLLWVLAGLAGLVLLALGVAMLWPAPQPQEATVSAVERGALLIYSGQSGAAILAEKGQKLRPGTRLSALPNTVALLNLGGQRLVRIESEGEWVVGQQGSDRIGQPGTFHVQQISGQASYVSRTGGDKRRSPLLIGVPGAIVQVMGASTVRTTSVGISQVLVLDGWCLAIGPNQSVEAQVGQAVRIEPGQPLRIIPGDSLP